MFHKIYSVIHEYLFRLTPKRNLRKYIDRKGFKLNYILSRHKIAFNFYFFFDAIFHGHSGKAALVFFTTAAKKHCPSISQSAIFYEWLSFRLKYQQKAHLGSICLTYSAHLELYKMAQAFELSCEVM